MARIATRSICRVALGLGLSLLSTGLMADDNTAETPTPATLEPADIKESTDAIPLTADDNEVKKPVGATEVIRERYLNTAIKVERHVAQDTQGNYFNHGPWTQFDEKGRMTGSGEYRNGKRNGKWIRWYGASEAANFTGPLYKDFQFPLATEATFTDGTLHGVWRIFDSKNRKVAEWQFENGERQGKSAWFYPSGQRRREMDFKNGEIDGEVIEWSIDAKIISRDKYMAGRKFAPQVDYHSAGKKRAEGWTLFAKDTIKSNYSWWDGVAATAVTGKEGVNQKRGIWTWWHPNGQKQMEGRYEEDLPVGKFTWWYENGQKLLEGEYEAGKQTGKFVWWHPNGQKQCEGIFTAGVQTGKWIRWTQEGKVVEVGDYKDHGIKSPVADTPAIDETEPVPALEAAQPPRNSSRLRR